MCAEEVQDEAIICKHCNSQIVGVEKTSRSKKPELNEGGVIFFGIVRLIFFGYICVVSFLLSLLAFFYGLQSVGDTYLLYGLAAVTLLISIWTSSLALKGLYKKKK